MENLDYKLGEISKAVELIACNIDAITRQLRTTDEKLGAIENYVLRQQGAMAACALACGHSGRRHFVQHGYVVFGKVIIAEVML
jgi:hypothetical protein